MVGMVSVLQTATPAETAGALSVLQLVAKDGPASQRLKELIAEREAAQELFDNTKAIQDQIAEKQANADASIAEANKLLSSVSTKEKAVAASLADIARREQNLCDAIDAHNKDNSKRKAEIEMNLAARSADLEKRSEEFDVFSTDTRKRADARQAVLDNKANELRVWEQKILAMDQAHRVEDTKMAKRRADLEAVLDQLRGLVK